ncbi:MAG: flippase-like domain-containing protein [Vallitaleaceae bacterium]|nr:flippase-like domain-containing protein [Vallitaleaceae bacterium]
MNTFVKKKNMIFFFLLTFLILTLTIQDEFILILLEIKKASLIWLGLGLIGIVSCWLIDARILYIMLKNYDTKLSYLEVLKLVLSTQFFNGITPFATGGQPFQIYILSKRSKIGVSSITSVSLHNFIIYQTVLVIMGSLAILLKGLLHLLPSDGINLNILCMIGFSLNVLIIILLLIIAFSPKLTQSILTFLLYILSHTPWKKKKEIFELKLSKLTKDFHTEILNLMANRQLLLQAAFLNFVKLTFFYAIAFFIFRSVGLTNINLVQAMISSAYVALITSVIPLPGASGGAEVGFLFFFSAVTIGPQITAVMLLWRFITYYLGLITGMFTVFSYNNKNLQKNLIS